MYFFEQNKPGEHGVWMSLLNLSTELLDILAGPMVSIPLRRLLLQWQRAAEFSCDRAALLVAQDYKVRDTGTSNVMFNNNQRLHYNSIVCIYVVKPKPHNVYSYMYIIFCANI